MARVAEDLRPIEAMVRDVRYVEVLKDVDYRDESY
jgi:hypothetical protein